MAKTKEQKSQEQKEKKERDKAPQNDTDLIEIAEQQIGKECLRFGLDTGGISRVGFISTRVLSLDIALGIGGVPRGRIVEIFGPEGSGKTTLSLSILAQCQADGGQAAFIDAEHALDPAWCRTLGVDTGKILFSQPDSAEQIFKLITLLIKYKKVDLIVVDSVAAMATEAELGGEVGEKLYPELARLMSQELRKLKGEVSKTNTCLIFINQIRDKIGSPIPMTSTPGGRALKFYASQRMEIKRVSATKQGEEIIGSHVSINVLKNKVAPPFKRAEFDILYAKGISKPHDLVALGLQHKFVTRSGSWVSYGDKKLGLGAIKAGDALVDMPDVVKDLEEKLRIKLLPEIQEAKITEEDLVEEI